MNQRVCRGVVVWAAVLAATSFAPARLTGDDTVRVGVAQVDITPRQPVCMYGYASRKTESEGIAGRLRAKSLAIMGTDAEGPAVLLTVDSGAVPSEIYDEVLAGVARKSPVKRERFVLSNSHCHSGPNLKGRKTLSGTEREHLDDYARELTEKLVNVVLESLAAPQPARLAWAQGTAAVAANRRVLKNGKWSGFGAVPDAPVDHSLPVLRVTGLDGKLIAVVLNYACHNTTLRGDFMGIHGDWSGCAQQAIETDNPGALALITLGCGADADPSPHGTVALCEQHGRAIADEVKRLLAGPFRPVRPPLTARRAAWDFPYQPLPPLDEIKQRAKGSYALQNLLTRLESGESVGGKRGYQVVTWTFGEDLAMVFLSDEVVVDYALRIKKEMDGGRLWVTAYANDVSNYVASDRLIGEGGYEVRNSISSLISYGKPETVQPSVEEQIIDHVRQLLPPAFQRGK